MLRDFNWLTLEELDYWAEFWNDIAMNHFLPIADEFYWRAAEMFDSKRCLEEAAKLQALGGEEHQDEADILRLKARWLRHERRRFFRQAHKYNRLSKLAQGDSEEFAWAAKCRRWSAEDERELEAELAKMTEEERKAHDAAMAADKERLAKLRKARAAARTQRAEEAARRAD
jgi:hypothetical protein